MRASEFISESTTIVSAEKLWDYVSKIHPKDQQGVAEGSEEITEYRDRMYQYIKSIVPGFPDYVVKDWLYANFAKGETYNKEKGWSFATVGKDIPNILKDMGLSVDTKWQLVPDMKFTMSMWEPKTLKRLQARAGGKQDAADPDVHIPARDAERHTTQASLAKQQGGVRKEPVILLKTSQGYELMEGWHRTIQHFAMYPEGYTGPAWVAVAQGQQGVAEALTRRDMLKGLAGAAAVGATGAQAGQFIDYDKLIKDPELETVWVPRMQKLQQRCNVMLSKLLRTAGSAWGEQLKGTTVRVESNEQHIQADANERSISVDLTVFWDAPEDVLAFAIGHELGHIALGHNDVPSSPEQSRKDESNADNFAVRLCKALGYNKAGVFKFLYAKKGEIENMNRLTSQPNSTHPTMTQRMDRARQQGFQLSKGGVQQMNTLLTHLA